MVPIVSVVGPSKADRTLIVEKLIVELRKRGYKIATVKRDAHSHDLDTPGKTSWRHSQAGAQAVIVSSAKRITLFKQVDKEWNLNQLTEEFLSDADIVITDGFAGEKKPKIKVLLSLAEEDNHISESELFSVVTTDAGGENSYKNVPTFRLEETEKLADLVERKLLKQS